MKVYVFNDNIHPLREMFKGDPIEIAAKDYWREASGEKKVMDLYEANDFRGQYRPVPFDGSGKMVDDARYHKKLKIEPVDENIDEITTTSFKCMAKECKHVSPSAEELEAHAKVRHPNTETLVLPEEDGRLKKKKAQGTEIQVP